LTLALLIVMSVGALLDGASLTSLTLTVKLSV